MYLGNYNVGDVIRVDMNSFLTTGASGNFSGDLEADDFRIYKNNGTTQRSSMAGVTVTNAPFDGAVVGYTTLDIDTSDNTDAGYWTPGEYALVLFPDTETLSGLAMNGRVVRFSINRPDALMRYVGLLGGYTSVSSITLPTSCPAVADVLVGAWVLPLCGTGKDQRPAMISAYTSGRAATLDPPLVAALSASDSYVGVLLAPPGSTSDRAAIAAAVNDDAIARLDGMTASDTEMEVDGTPFDITRDADGFVTSMALQP